jgi:hypothetical protein
MSLWTLCHSLSLESIHQSLKRTSYTPKTDNRRCVRPIDGYQIWSPSGIFVLFFCFLFVSPLSGIIIFIHPFIRSCRGRVSIKQTHQFICQWIWNTKPVFYEKLEKNIYINTQLTCKFTNGSLMWILSGQSRFPVNHAFRFDTKTW